MSLILRLTGNTVKAVGRTVKIENYIDRVTRFQPKGFEHSEKYEEGTWDGWIHLYDARNGTFPYGLLNDVIDMLCAEEVDFTIDDQRSFRSFDPLPAIRIPSLRDYQTEAMIKAIEVKRGVICLPTGSGKTRTAIAIIARLRLPALFFVHKKELLYQTKDTLEKEFKTKIGQVGDGETDIQPITVAMVQTASRLPQELFRDYGVAIFDECLPGNVMITMSNGIAKRIDAITIGDSVASYSHDRTVIEPNLVTQIYCTARTEILKITLANGMVLKVTPDHKIWNGHEYCKASSLNTNDALYCVGRYVNAETSNCMPGMQKNLLGRFEPIPTSEDQTRSPSKAIRLPDMYPGVRKPLRARRTYANGPHDTEGKTKVLPENETHHKENKLGKKPTGRLQETLQKAKHTATESWKSKLERRNTHQNLEQDSTREQQEGMLLLPWSLGSQNRCSSQRRRLEKQPGGKSINNMQVVSRKHASRRSNNDIKRRAISYSKIEDKRTFKIYPSTIVSITKEIKIPPEIVYDISVEKNHNFIANGILVSNCHHAPADTVFDIAKELHCEYVIGLSATPRREDGKEMLIWAATGPICKNVSTSELIERKFLAKPYIDYIEVKAIPIGYHTKYQEVYKKAIVNNDERNGKIALKAVELAALGKVYVHVRQVAHGITLTSLINDALPDGYPKAEFIYGQDSSKTRQRVINSFRRKDLRIMVSTLLGEGMDLPEMYALILASGGLSRTFVQQVFGRVLRGSVHKVVEFWDVRDVCTYLFEHFLERVRFYKSEPAFVLSPKLEKIEVPPEKEE